MSCEHVVLSLGCQRVTCSYVFVRFRTFISSDTSTMEAKSDKLLASFKQLKDIQEANQQKMTEKLEKLEQDVHARLDMAAEQVVKKLKCDRSLEFKKKGHER